MFRIIVITLLFITMSNNALGSQHSQINSTSNVEKINKPSVSQEATAADILLSLEKPVPEVLITPPPLITGSAELGFLYKTGNTNSGDIKTGFDLRVAKDQWLSLLNFDLLIKKSEKIDSNTGKSYFETTDQKWSIASQTNYKINNSDKNYIYAALWYEDNNFNSFDNQSSISSGWGRHWYKTETASFWADIGPGYKRDVVKITDNTPEEVKDSWIIQAQTLYIRQLGENIEFKQYFSAKYAVKTGENSLLKAETTLTTKLISTLQLKFSFTVDYNSVVDEDKKNTDTQTAMTLVYSF